MLKTTAMMQSPDIIINVKEKHMAPSHFSDPDPNKSEKKISQKSAFIKAWVKVKSSPLCGPLLLLTLTAPSAAAWASLTCSWAIRFCLSKAGSKSTSLGFSSSTSLNITSFISCPDLLASCLESGRSASSAGSLVSGKKLNDTGITMGTARRINNPTVKIMITVYLKSTRSSRSITAIKYAAKRRQTL
ncbi:hypothetical protein RHMOL_Rhmol10G0007200 [Rhododendron molle]|uniref:Uncharacterized protein n=1 Tax=Rhododendron molle TaxID=49168 RepID=A0ACC0LYP8_RHOML|nr:hypothetical protein RHMOL_Rhmol10G0007200 [Rhododendron molle]